MKVLIILSLVAVALASLEPADYRLPGSSLSTRYSPLNDLRPPIVVPTSQYLPANRYSPPQNVIPTTQYLPPVRQSAAPLPPTTYLPSRHNIIPTLPNANYLPANRQTRPPFSATLSPFSSTTRSQSLTHEVTLPSNVYLPDNRFPGFERSSSSFDKFFLRSNPSSSSSIVKSVQSQYRPPNQLSSSRNLEYGYNAIDVLTPAKYDFEYNVNDEYGNDFGHKERRDGDSTEGVYTVLLPDGRKQIVHYQADQNGFRPRISYETGFAKLGSIGFDRNVGHDTIPREHTSLKKDEIFKITMDCSEKCIWH